MSLETGKSPADILDGKILASVIEAAPVGFGLHDANGKVTYVNRYMVDLFGFERASEIIGRDVASLIAEPYRADWAARVGARPEDHGDPYSLCILRSDGEEVRVLVRPVPILGDDGEIESEAAFVLDIASLMASDPASGHTGMDQKRLDELTTREREVFDCLIQGKSVREIAELSFISEHTVRNHIKAIYRKLGLHSRLDLLRAVLGH
jgi:LuxR family transcriptional regulator of spore coat protein